MRAALLTSYLMLGEEHLAAATPTATALNNSFTLYMGAFDRANSNVPLSIRGLDTVNTAPTLYVGGQDSQNNSDNLYIKGSDSLSNPCTLFIRGLDSSSAAIPLFIGLVPTEVTGQAPLFIAGRDSLSRSTPLFIPSYAPHTTPSLLYVCGRDSVSSIIPLFIEGATAASFSKAITLFIAGPQQVVVTPKMIRDFTLYIRRLLTNPLFIKRLNESTLGVRFMDDFNLDL